MTADPASAQIDGEFISGTIRIHHADQFNEYEFRSRHPFGNNCTIRSPWPHDEFQVLSADGQLRGGGVVANLGLTSELPLPLEANDFHVLYVGQAYGAEGERTAPDRLNSHSTFQRILADCPRDQQIWWMVASISDEQYFIEMAPPSHPSSTTDEEDRAHIKLVTETIDNPSFRESEAVSLAEAALIRYFQPQYNEIFKNEFPGRRHKMLDSLRRLDLLALLVELQAQDIPVRLGSERVASDVYHVATFYIHLDGPDRISDWAMRGLFEPAPG